MQRQEPEGVIISCDFCGTDWDQVLPMIEGHHGSVLCLECLKRAQAHMKPADGPFDCSLCLMQREAATPHWQPEPRPEKANPQAALCQSCLRQAQVAFDRDADVDYQKPPRQSAGRDEPDE